MYDNRIKFLYDILDFSLSIIRLFTNTHFKTTRRASKQHAQCIIMGNGPSLIPVLKENANSLHSYDLIAVNLAGIAPEYVKYKPSVYVLVDPAFWLQCNVATQEKIRNFYRTITESTSWKLQLYIPYEIQKCSEIVQLLRQNSNIEICCFNRTKFEGCRKISRWIYKKQWGMPRVQNVLAAALMLAIHARYKTIYLAGADNNWSQNLWVDEYNNLVLNEPHYYDDKKNIERRIQPVKLHEQYASLHQTFKSYIEIEAYAKRMAIKIYNLNPLSFIDAFEKKTLHAN